MAQVAPPEGTAARSVDQVGVLAEAQPGKAVQLQEVVVVVVVVVVEEEVVVVVVVVVVVEGVVERAGKGARPGEVEAVLAGAAPGHSAPVNAPRVAALIRASPVVPMEGAWRPGSVAIKVTEPVSAASP